MPYFQTSEEWQRHSSLLLQARPRTTRITTKYNIRNLDSPKYTKKRTRDGSQKTSDSTTNDPSQPQQARIPKAYLTLKTYDSESGVVLKYKTDKAAEVGRLIGSLGRLGRHMAALPQVTEDVAMTEAPVVEQETNTTISPATAGTTTETAKGQATNSGAGKKKKKGKK